MCDEWQIPCYMALAPNHIYIKLFTEKTGWFNTELTSASFPIDEWLMASGYINIEAIQNGIYMDTLSEKQSLALCILDLAKGYDRTYPINDGAFIVKCCDLALTHYPKSLNARILKAETKRSNLKN